MALARRAIDAGGDWLRRLPIAEALQLFHQQAMMATQGIKT